MRLPHDGSPYFLLYFYACLSHMLPMPKEPKIQNRASHAATPQIFSPKKLKLAQARARKRRAKLTAPQFLFERVAQDMADRIVMINRQFQSALLIAPEGFETRLNAYIPTDKQPQKWLSTPLSNLGPNLKDKDPFDLILIAFSHHTENDPVGLFKALSSFMVADSHIITVCLGGESLSQLRQAFYSVDQAHYNGVIPRIHPMIAIQENVLILANAGFNLTSGDRDRVAVNYRQLTTLISDLRDMGETYKLMTEQAVQTTRSFWTDVEENLKVANDKIAITYDILWSSGWMPHESQQKPLKPGSAKFHLSKAFNAKEED